MKKSGATARNRSTTAKKVTAKGKRTLTGATGFNLAIPSSLGDKLIVAANKDGYTGKMGWSKYVINQLKEFVV